MALWARIAQNVKKPSHTVNVIGFYLFFVLMYPNKSLGVPLVPKSHDTLAVYSGLQDVERNKVHFAPF